MDEASGFFEENSRAHVIVDEEKEFTLDFAVTQKPPLQPKPISHKKVLQQPQLNKFMSEGEKTIKPINQIRQLKLFRSVKSGDNEAT